MASLRFAVVPLCAALALSQEPAGPTFVAGDLAALACRVVTCKAGEDGMQLLTVEVQNRGTVDAEPLTFQIEVPAKKGAPPLTETFARAQLPHVARYGRPAPAGGKQTYLLSTMLPGKKGQFTVRVTSASFVDGGMVPKPAFGFGKPEQVQRESMAGTFPVTTVAVTNPLPCEVDVLLLITYEQPKDVVELAGLRLEANATRDVVIATRPGRELFLDPLLAAPGCAIKATAFQVVDWCLAGSLPKDAGVSMLRDAYAAWYRWPESDAAVAGAFTFREHRLREAGKEAFDDFVIKGRFTLATSGEVAIEMLEGKGANASFLLRDALSNLRRPAFDTLALENQLTPVAPGRVAIVGPGWHLLSHDSGAHQIGGSVKAEESPDLEVRDGRIVGSGQGEQSRIAWETRLLDGAVVVMRRWNDSQDSRYAYAVRDGRVVPTTASHVQTIGGKLFSAAELELTDLKFEVVTPLAAAGPEGEGVDGLRALWDAAYRLPTAPIELAAKFEVTTGNDGVWRGRKKFGGTIKMRGIGRNLRASDCTFAGNLAREDEVQLAAMLRDRLLMWYGVDFNDRPPFDEFFRGARIHAPDGDGVFVVDRCQVDRVWTSGGLVRGFRARDDSGQTKFTYAKVAERNVVVRIDVDNGGEATPAAHRWKAATIVTMAAVGDQVLPVKIVFEHAFGRDWEPETIVLRDLRVLK